MQYETILTPGNIKHVHHWLMYECSKNYDEKYLVNNTAPNPGICEITAENQTIITWNDVKMHCMKISLGFYN